MLFQIQSSFDLIAFLKQCFFITANSLSLMINKLHYYIITNDFWSVAVVFVLAMFLFTRLKNIAILLILAFAAMYFFGSDGKINSRALEIPEQKLTK